ncbi:MAG: hypothetical protein ACLQBX_07015 [Candidatus Limnocylindrales bacterium]
MCHLERDTGVDEAVALDEAILLLALAGRPEAIVLVREIDVYAIR